MSLSPQVRVIPYRNNTLQQRRYNSNERAKKNPYLTIKEINEKERRINILYYQNIDLLSKEIQKLKKTNKDNSDSISINNNINVSENFNTPKKFKRPIKFNYNSEDYLDLDESNNNIPNINTSTNDTNIFNIKNINSIFNNNDSETNSSAIFNPGNNNKILFPFNNNRMNNINDINDKYKTNNIYNNKNDIQSKAKKEREKTLLKKRNKFLHDKINKMRGINKNVEELNKTVFEEKSDYFKLQRKNSFPFNIKEDQRVVFNDLNYKSIKEKYKIINKNNHCLNNVNIRKKDYIFIRNFIVFCSYNQKDIDNILAYVVNNHKNISYILIKKRLIENKRKENLIEYNCLFSYFERRQFYKSVYKDFYVLENLIKLEDAFVYMNDKGNIYYEKNYPKVKTNPISKK